MIRRPAAAQPAAEPAAEQTAPAPRAPSSGVPSPEALRRGRWPRAAGLARAAELGRRHWLAVLLLAAGLALRVLALAAYRPALLYIDSERYLHNANGMDPVGYAGLLRPALLAGGFEAVVVIQHLLGLAMGVLSYLVLLRRGVPRWLAAVAIAPVLLDAYQLQIEQEIMPDTLFEALIVAGLAVVLWQPRVTWRRAAAGGLLLGACATVAQVGEALLLPAVIFLLAVGGGWRRAAGRAGVLCAAFVLPILAYCTVSYLVAGNFFLSHAGVTSLYGRTAAAADCGTLRLPAAERGMCPDPAQQAQGPDWLEYNQASPIRPYYRDPSRAGTDAMISDFNHRVLAQQPLRVLAAYGRDVAKLFMLTRATGQGDTPIARWQFQTSFPYFSSHSTRADVQAELGRFAGGGRPAVWRPGAAFLRSYQLGGGYPPGPLLALAAVTGLAGSAALLRRRTRADPAARQLALACLLYFAAAAFVLLMSDLFEFSWRYQLPALVTLVPAGALGISVLARLPRRRPG